MHQLKNNNRRNRKKNKKTTADSIPLRGYRDSGSIILDEGPSENNVKCCFKIRTDIY